MTRDTREDSSSLPRRRPRRRGPWPSILLFLGLLFVWCSVLTVVFCLLFDDFLFRVTHPFNSGFSMGPWGFLFIYILLCLPVVPVHSWLDRQLDEWHRLHG